MNARIMIAAPLVLAAAGAIAATGFTSRTSEMPPAATPADDVAIAPAATNDSAPPGPAMRDTAMVPATAHYVQPSVTVTAPRPSDDELLRNVVMDRLSSDGRLSGTIGVQAYQHTVSLTGRVLTTGQVDRAGMIAHGVDGVWDVNNDLRTRVGQS
jgi:hypothetical protein